MWSFNRLKSGKSRRSNQKKWPGGKNHEKKLKYISP
jgi:hypothetical protein